MGKVIALIKRVLNEGGFVMKSLDICSQNHSPTFQAYIVMTLTTRGLEKCSQMLLLLQMWKTQQMYNPNTNAFL